MRPERRQKVGRWAGKQVEAKEEAGTRRCGGDREKGQAGGGRAGERPAPCPPSSFPTHLPGSQSQTGRSWSPGEVPASISSSLWAAGRGQRQLSPLPLLVLVPVN